MAQKSIYEVEIGGEIYEIEADSPQEAAAAATKHPLWKATQGMNDRPDQVTDTPESARADKRARFLETAGPVTKFMETKFGPFIEGPGKQAQDMVTGLAQLPGAFKEDPLGTLGQVIVSPVTGAYNTLKNAVSGDPEKMGRSVFDLGMLTVPMVPGKAGTSAADVGTTVAKAGARRGLAAANEIAARGAEFAEANPAVGVASSFVPGATARATTRLFNALRREGGAEGGAAARGPKKGGPRLVDPRLEAAVAQALDENLSALPNRAPVSEFTDVPLQDYFDEAAASPARAGATTEFMREPNANAGGQMSRSGGRVSRGTDPIENSILEALQGMRRPESVELAPSHPTGGEFTIPAPTSPNAGGRLATRMNNDYPPISIDAAIAQALNEYPPTVEMARSHPVGGGFTTPSSRRSVSTRRTSESFSQLEEARRQRGETANVGDVLKAMVDETTNGPDTRPSAKPPAVRPRDPNPDTPEFKALEAERKAIEEAEGIFGKKSTKRAPSATIPASRSRRTPMSATPGLTVNDVEVLGLNPSHPITGLSDDAISQVLRARLVRSGKYRTEAALAKELARLLEDSRK